MAKTLYFDCFSGVSGDMVVGGLLDLGLPLDDLRAALGTLPVEHAVSASRVLRAGVSATKFTVTGPHSAHPHDHPAHSSHSHDHPTRRTLTITPRITR